MRSGRRLFLGGVLLVPLLLGGCDFRRTEVGESGETGRGGGDAAGEVEAMLHASAASWNGGDLDGFLDDYWNSPELTFSGATGVTRGWQDVRERYLRSYWAPEAVRDSLRFEDLEITPLGDEHALALGRYVLFRPEEEETVSSTGFFSLVLERMEEGWKILHDHTSTAPDAEETQGDQGPEG